MFSVLNTLLFSLILLYSFESLINDDFYAPLVLFKKNTLCFFYNILILFLLLSFLISITNQTFFVYLVISAFFIIIATINHQLRYYRNEYLKPIDLLLFKESRKISKNIEFIYPKGLLCNCMILLFCSYILYFIDSTEPLFISFPILIVFCTLLQSDFFKKNIFRIKCDKFSDFNDFKNNGYLLTFISQLNSFKNKVPIGYKEGISHTFLQNTPTRTPFKKPNIIIIMNESFFNINKVPNIDLSYNPLPNFEKISKYYTSGNVISPVIGGGTCQPEFEMLTGNSVIFTNKFKVAFIDFFKKPIKYFDSIAWTLRKISYSCTFIHPYSKKFYNREKAYNALGFEKILDIDDFNNAFYPRNFISDMDCYKMLVNQFEKKQPKKPFFSVVVTMQNHPGYYDGEKYDEYGLEVFNENITYKEKVMLENYANLLKESDNAIGYITDYFKDKEDTVILFFGDHQPSDNIGFSSIASRNELELSKTPFFIWDNYGLPKRIYENISPFYLSPILLDVVGIKSDKYFNFLYEQLNTLHAFNTGFVIDRKNNYIHKKDSPKEIEELIHTLSIMQHDRINNCLHKKT